MGAVLEAPTDVLGPLAGKIGVVLGIANTHSIAAGCARHFAKAGATLVATYLNETARPYVEAVTQALPCAMLLACDVREPGSLEAVFDAVRTRYDRLDFVLHAIAFAPRDDLHDRVTDCSAAGFALAMDVSCHSFIRTARLAEPLMKSGGTLLAIAAAAMARDADKSLASVGLLAAQTDFTEPGEVQVFMDEGQLAELDELMAKQIYLDGSHMAAAFAMLRAADMIWSRSTRRYYLGEQEKVSDMMSWDADTTRMPARMHSEYLHRLYLRNDLAEGRLIVEDRPVAISDIKVPCFLVSAETDWVAPWKSVYKFLLLNGADVTFALASGGHNGGIVSVPGTPHRHYRLLRRLTSTTFKAAQPWMDATPPIAGSWWTEYVAFLGTQSSPAAAPPPMGNAAVGLGPLELAPGSYVMQR